MSLPAHHPQQITVMEGGAASAPLDPFAGVEFLTKYESTAPARPDFLACISAGYKGENGNPVVSRDGTIYLSDPQGRAPGLAAALAESGGKSLMITLPSDAMRDIFFQHFRKEGKSRLEAYGDAKGIWTIGPKGEREFHPTGSPSHQALMREVKPTFEIAFYLARWVTTPGQMPRPEMYWPDGVGYYRIRTTSEKTIKNFRACVSELSRLTGGRIAGIPIELRLTYPQVADPTGTKRQVPLFSFTFKPPHEIVMDPAHFRRIAHEAVKILPSMSLLALPSPASLDDALAEFDAELLTVPLDAETARQRYFGITQGTPHAKDEGRAALLAEFTGGEFASLAAFLAQASPEEMGALLTFAEMKVAGPASSEPITVDAELVEDEPKEAPVDDPNSKPTPDLLKQISDEMQRAGWNASKGRAYLKDAFEKTTRADLTRGEATAFLNYLKTLPTYTPQEETGDA